MPRHFPERMGNQEAFGVKEMKELYMKTFEMIPD
jgi:hypothetical protein